MTTASNVPAEVRLISEWLDGKHVEHELRFHSRAHTAQTTALAAGVPPDTFAKVVGVRTDSGRPALLVVDATEEVDLRKAAAALGVGRVELLSEHELAALAPACEPGAMPALGRLFGLEMVADLAVGVDPRISFNAGSHRWSVRVDRAGWERAANVCYASLAADRATGARTR